MVAIMSRVLRAGPEVAVRGRSLLAAASSTSGGFGGDFEKTTHKTSSWKRRYSSFVVAAAAGQASVPVSALVAAAFAGGFGAGFVANHYKSQQHSASPGLGLAGPEPLVDGEEEVLVKLEGHHRTKVEDRRRRQAEEEEAGAAEGVPGGEGNAVKSQVWFGFKQIPKGGIHSLYTIKQQLGEGSFGRTFLAVDQGTGKEIAMKILPKSMISCADSIEDVDREVEIMKQLSGHNHVCEFFNAFEDKETVFIAMEVCKGGELYDAVQERKGNYTEDEAASVIRQILKVLAHCHNNGIVYCDVKPENFLYLNKDQKILKAIDFGLSRHFTPLGRALRKPRGTAYYVAPEVMRFEYGPEADMWSLGIIAYLLLSGKVPFAGESDADILKEVMHGKKVDLESGPWRKVSAGAKSFIRGVLERDVGLRMTAVQALNHPWLRREGSALDFEDLVDAAGIAAIHAFAKYGRMRKLALRAVAGVVADSGVMIDDLKFQFQVMDQGKDQTISKEELQSALEKTTWKHTDREIKELLDSIHCYTYGPFREASTGAKIDYHEFLAASLSMKQLEKKIQDKEQWEKILREAFGFFDRDGDGVISAEDLRTCLASDRGNEDALVRECLVEAGAEKTGKITFADFIALLKMDDPCLSSRYGYVKTPSRSKVRA